MSVVLLVECGSQWVATVGSRDVWEVRQLADNGKICVIGRFLHHIQAFAYACAVSGGHCVWQITDKVAVIGQQSGVACVNVPVGEIDVVYPMTETPYVVQPRVRQAESE